MQTWLGTIMCKFGSVPAICLPEEAIFVKSQKCPYHVTFDLDLDLEHNLDAGLCGDHRVQVWWRSIHVCGFQKCPYHVTFDLDLDLEQTLDAGPSADYHVQVWSRSSHLPVRSDFRHITKVSVSRDL